ncbi:MAG: urease accessory UreF family protein [Steroidobacteraceae bacterium]|jgi:urease accessory protein
MNKLAGMRLLQLASQSLPIGGYSHSQGLESAIEARIVHSEASVHAWIEDVLVFCMASYELAVLLEMCEAWSAGDLRALRRLNDEFLAARETAELRAATVQMGYSMRALLSVLPDIPAGLTGALSAMQEPSLPLAWSGAAIHWSIEPGDAAGAYLWSWAENQVLAAVKTLPMGQSAGQRVLMRIGARIAQLQLEMPCVGARPRSNFAPGLAISSARHETQYSRLFRS